jgi:RND family efflux transporter MFP subunit
MNHAGRTTLCIAALVPLLVAGGCERPVAPAGAPAAQKPKAEADLARTTLTPEQARSLGVRSAAAVTRPVQDVLELGGWVVARPGCEVTVTAPVAGYVQAPSGQTLPAAGQAVSQGQELWRIEPVLSPVEQVQLAALKLTLENERTKARDAAAVAESEWKRLVELQRTGLRGQQEVEQAEARLKYARADLAAAQAKLDAFADTPDARGSARLQAIPLAAPRAGTVLAVAVGPGQYVPAGAALVTVADLREPWLRVPVPEADLPGVDRAQPATVTLGPGRRCVARPVGLVPQADPVRHTADVLYELPASPGQVWVKDQLLAVTLAAGAARPQAVVPAEAVVYDIHGGAWIYLDRTPDRPADEGKVHVYERRRVQVGAAAEGGLVVRPRLGESDRVVVAGAAALFSREFHKPPAAGATPPEDDD